jgi:hypothetical protein
VVQNSTRSRSIVISNSAASGAATLSLSQCTLSNTSFALELPGGFPQSLAAGTSLTLMLSFNASALGAANASLSCVHSASAQNAIWPLQAQGVAQTVLSSGFEDAIRSIDAHRHVGPSER